MNKKYYSVPLLICVVLIISACKQSGASSGTASRKPFIGGTGGLTMNFEKDSPPPEVTDDGTFAFNSIVRLKNDGEFKVSKDDVKLNLLGFDANDFGSTLPEMSEVTPDDDLDPKRMDAEGSIIEGTTTFATFPKSGKDFIPKRFPGNTEFTFRSEVCYHYNTDSNTKLCILRDMINERPNSICKPGGSKQVYSSSAPVQILNFRESVVGKDKISFSFDIVLSGNVDIFWSNDKTTPSSGFDAACPRDPRKRRAAENSVGVELKEIPVDPIFSNLKCGGLDGTFKGVVRLINGRRTITCTSDLTTARNDLEKLLSINLEYNVLDNKETKILVKHFISS